MNARLRKSFLGNDSRSLFAAAVICWTLGIVIRAQQPTVWDGVYTAAQAKRGAEVYTAICARCHGKALEGDNASSPPLTGAEFMTTWNGSTLGGLFTRIRNSMPDDDPGTLTDEQSADALSYILNFNKFPDGKTELPHDAEMLKKIRFDAVKK